MDGDMHAADLTSVVQRNTLVDLVLEGEGERVSVELGRPLGMVADEQDRTDGINQHG
jgi:hypothetical protein